VLSRAARGVVPDAPAGFRIFYRDDVLTLSAKQLRGLRRMLLNSQHHRNRAAPRVPDELINALWHQVSGDRALERGKEEFAHTMLGTREFTDFAAAWWPVVDAVDVLGWLADKERLQRDAHEILTPEEIDELVESWAADDFSVEDVPLLDELRYLVGEPPEPEREPDPLDDLYDEQVPELSTVDQRWDGAEPSRSWTNRPTQSIDDDAYAHVLVDEAQDLSPMQWRMLGRRGRQATWTIVGDPAQSSWPYADEAATARAEALDGKDQSSFRLSTNYRNSAEIFELAAELAAASIPGADLPIAVRSTGVEPRLQLVDPANLADSVREAMRGLLTLVDGTIGVVVPVGWRDRVDGWLGDRDRSRIPVLEALDTKGLEFDGILLVEPDGIVDESPAGIRTLYVVLTRATQQLDVVGTSERWRP
jgi:hypothetical protein